MARRLVLLLALLAAHALPGAAAAHVDVLPTTMQVGVAGEIVVRVPTERPLPTVRVEVLFPPQVTVYAFAPAPAGWTARPLLAADGRNRGVVFSGGSIGVGRYQDFTMLGTPFTAGDAVWRARQTYADGRVKPWTAAPEPPGTASVETGPTQPGPASLMRIVPAGAPATTTAATTATTAAPSGEAGGSSGSSPAGIVLSVLAILIAVAAGAWLLVTRRRGARGAG